MELTAWNVRRANKRLKTWCEWVVDLSPLSCATQCHSESVNLRNVQIDGIFSHLISIFRTCIIIIIITIHYCAHRCCSAACYIVVEFLFQHFEYLYFRVPRPGRQMRRVNYTRWCRSEQHFHFLYSDFGPESARVPEIFRGRYVYRWWQSECASMDHIESSCY